jgi:hypothetical protein
MVSAPCFAFEILPWTQTYYSINEGKSRHDQTEHSLDVHDGYFCVKTEPVIKECMMLKEFERM